MLRDCYLNKQQNVSIYGTGQLLPTSSKEILTRQKHQPDGKNITIYPNHQCNKARIFI